MLQLSGYLLNIAWKIEKYFNAWEVSRNYTQPGLLSADASKLVMDNCLKDWEHF